MYHRYRARSYRENDGDSCTTQPYYRVQDHERIHSSARSSRRATHLEEVEAVGAAAGEVLHRLIQVLCVLHLTAAQHLRHAHRAFLLAPIQLVDVRVVAGFDAFVSVLRPEKDGVTYFQLKSTPECHSLPFSTE